MPLNINLLKKTRALSEKQYQLEKRVVAISIFVFGIVVVISIGLFSWMSLLSVRITNVDDKIATANRELAGLKSASSMQLYIKSRLNSVATFLDNRAKTRESLQRIFSLPIEGVTVSSAVFEDETHLKIQLTTDDVATFDQVYTLFESSREFFTEVINNGVTQTDTGLYTISYLLTLPTGVAE